MMDYSEINLDKKLTPSQAPINDRPPVSGYQFDAGNEKDILRAEMIVSALSKSDEAVDFSNVNIGSLPYTALNTGTSTYGSGNNSLGVGVVYGASGSVTVKWGSAGLELYEPTTGNQIFSSFTGTAGMPYFNDRLEIKNQVQAGTLGINTGTVGTVEPIYFYLGNVYIGLSNSLSKFHMGQVDFKEGTVSKVDNLELVNKGTAGTASAPNNSVFAHSGDLYWKTGGSAIKLN